METFGYRIDWSDGTSADTGAATADVAGNRGVRTAGPFDSTHIYADNGAYTVTVTVTDDDGGVTVDTLIVTVQNVAPTLNAGVDQTVNEGQLTYLDPSAFNDLGTLDTHAATINWGDGTTTEAGPRG